jgi:hypothetical protein
MISDHDLGEISNLEMTTAKYQINSNNSTGYQLNNRFNAL